MKVYFDEDGCKTLIDTMACKKQQCTCETCQSLISGTVACCSTCKKWYHDAYRNMHAFYILLCSTVVFTMDSFTKFDPLKIDSKNFLFFFYSKFDLKMSIYRKNIIFLGPGLSHFAGLGRRSGRVLVGPGPGFSHNHQS